jgi:putative ABC transport system permease protein
MGFARKPEYSVYLPFSFNSDAASLVLHTARSPLEFATAVREVFKRIDPDLPITSLSSLEQAQADLGEPLEFLLVLLGGIAATAVAISAIGLYGVASRTVTAQTREIGIRMALGASGGAAIAQVLRHGARLTVLGIALGTAAAIVVAKVLASEYWWLATSQVPLIGLLALSLGVISVLACYLPARKAGRIEPAVTLRSE